MVVEGVEEDDGFLLISSIKYLYPYRYFVLLNNGFRLILGAATHAAFAPGCL